MLEEWSSGIMEVWRRRIDRGIVSVELRLGFLPPVEMTTGRGDGKRLLSWKMGFLSRGLLRNDNFVFGISPSGRNDNFIQGISHRLKPDSKWQEDRAVNPNLSYRRSLRLRYLFYLEEEDFSLRSKWQLYLWDFSLVSKWQQSSYATLSSGWSCIIVWVILLQR